MATIYFIMGVVVVSAGVVPLSQIGIASVFVDTQGGGVTAENENIAGSGDGMLDNLIGPVKNALNTIAGGALLAVWGPISKLTGFYAWPVVTANYIGAPRTVTLASGALVASFTFGVLRVFRASV